MHIQVFLVKAFSRKVHQFSLTADCRQPFQGILAFDATLGEFNPTPFVMTHTITFDETQARVALHMWSHSIKIPPNQSDTYGTPPHIFCNSQILSQKCPPEPSSEDNDASLLAMETTSSIIC
jgi:hypothetical protein